MNAVYVFLGLLALGVILENLTSTDSRISTVIIIVGMVGTVVGILQLAVKRSGLD